MQEIRDRQETFRTVPGSPASRGAWQWEREGGFWLRQIMGSVLVVIIMVAVPAMAQAGALHQAVKAGDLDELTRLLESGADVDARDKRGRTALMYAVNKGYVLLVEPLLAAKANPNVRAPDGATALFMAVALGHSEIITMLKKAGADPTIKGPKGKTANDVAQDRIWQKTPPGSVFRDCEQCPEMVVIPTGRFQMGDVSGAGIGYERPVHRVTIEYPFAVGKYEVTFAEWDACVAAGGCSHRRDSEGRGTRPVNYVSWKDAQEYVQWLSRETGKPYRLLSEAEWEYVARAGTTTTYWWGNALGTNKANCNGCGSQWDNKRTAPVGSFTANAFGVFDTAGNVWEWVEDCWHANYEGAPADGRAWTSEDCTYRVVRGGSWYDNPEFMRPAHRNRNNPGDRGNEDGFRLARTLTP